MIEADIAIVGAGPAGIALALGLSREGHRVVLLESGSRRFDRRAQRLGDTLGDDPHHVPMSLTTRRQLGGASNIWGGRCVPFDPIDFEPRPLTGDARWPIEHDELAPYVHPACDLCRCGEAVFDAHAIPGARRGPCWTRSLLHARSGDDLRL
jgi:choline dehydrogenase-like flavoprotein